jgi:hypothetical protein
LAGFTGWKKNDKFPSVRKDGIWTKKVDLLLLKRKIVLCRVQPEIVFLFTLQKNGPYLRY